MRTNGRKRLLMIAGLGLVVFMPLLAFAAPDSDDSLSALKGAYEKALNTLVTNAAASVAGCSDGYVAALKALQLKLQKDGDLDGWTDVEELDRFQAEKRITEAGLSNRAEIQAVQVKYKELPQQVRLAKSQKIVALSQKYLAMLAALQTDLTKQGKMDDALAVHAEIKRVKASSEVSAAQFELSSQEATTAAGGKEAGPGTAPAGAKALATAIDTNKIPAFAVLSYELAAPVQLVNKFIQAVYPLGIKVRVAADSLDISSVFFSPNGIPQYGVRSYPQGAISVSVAFSLNGQTVRSVLQEICRRAKLAFRVDEERQELVIVDPEAPDAEWIPENLNVKKRPAPTTDLDNMRIGRFWFNESDVDNATQIINNFVAAVSSKGIRVRVAADALKIRSINYDQAGVPRYLASFQPHAGNRDRIRTFTLTDASALDILRVICISTGLAYKIDTKSGEIVILDGTATDAQWVPQNLPTDQLLRESQSATSRDKHVGKDVIVTGRVASVGQGVNDLIVTLDNKIRLSLPKDSAGQKPFDEVKARLNEAKDRDRGAGHRRIVLEITVLGRVAKSTGMGVVLDKCVVLELYTGTAE